jgi:hypothetical protein
MFPCKIEQGSDLLDMVLVGPGKLVVLRNTSEFTLYLKCFHSGRQDLEIEGIKI